jgi:hypothetical protein
MGWGKSAADSLEDLRANKEASGRTKDVADLENLPNKAKPKSKNRKK